MAVCSVHWVSYTALQASTISSLLPLLCRNVSLKNEVKALKKKEAEDTKALEDIVQQVESNLVTTTVSGGEGRKGDGE